MIAGPFKKTVLQENGIVRLWEVQCASAGTTKLRKLQQRRKANGDVVKESWVTVRGSLSCDPGPGPGPVRDEIACCVKKIGLYNHRRNDLRTSTRIGRRIDLIHALI